MKRHEGTVVLLIVLAVASLAALGHASPPDPTWLGGVWDGADYDDVVIIATSAVAVDDGVRLETASPRWIVLGPVDAGRSPDRRSAEVAIARDRAPPIA